MHNIFLIHIFSIFVFLKVIERYLHTFFICGNPAGARCTGDVPWSSSPNAQDLQETFRGLFGDQHKNWWFNEKSVS